MANELPARPQDPLDLEASHLRVVVNPGRHGPGRGRRTGCKRYDVGACQGRFSIIDLYDHIIVRHGLRRRKAWDIGRDCRRPDTVFLSAWFAGTVPKYEIVAESSFIGVRSEEHT